MRINWKIVLCGWTALILFTAATLSPVWAADALDPKDQAAEEWEERVAPLKAAGIDPESNQALLHALTLPDKIVKRTAIDLLQERKEKAAIPEIRKLLNDEWQGLRLSACDALAALGDDRSVWEPPCVNLLKSKDPIIQLGASYTLAQYGNASGWEIVKANLPSDRETLSYEAAQSAPLFDGLDMQTDKGMVKINVFDTAFEMFKTAPGSAQTNLALILARLAKPADVPRLKALLNLLKPENLISTKDILQTAISYFEAQPLIDHLKEILASGKADKPPYNKALLISTIQNLEREQRRRAKWIGLDSKDTVDAW